MKAKKLYLPAFAALASVVPASADIIYSNFQNIVIPATFDGVYLNVETGAWNTDMTAPVAGWDINPFYGGRSLANSPGFQPVRSSTGSSSPIVNLSAGDSIGTSSVISTFVQGAGGENPGGDGYGVSSMLTGMGGNFTAGTEGYLGFRLNGTNYGWMRATFTNNAAGAAIKDWAYDNTTGTTIKAGLIQTNVTSGVLTTTTLNPGSADSFTLASSLTNGAVSGGYTNSVLKQGLGTVTLSATSTYTGATTITAGTLAVSSSGSINTSSGVTITSGGTFRYNSSTALSPTLTFTGGTIGGTNLTGSLDGLSIGSGQTLSPGATAGPGITNTGSQTWAGSGTYQFGIHDAAGSAGSSTGWDLVSGSGALNISADSGSKFNIDLTSLGLNDEAGTADNFSDLTSYAWKIADFGSAITTFAANAFAVDTTHFGNTYTGTFGVALGDTVSGGDSSQLYLTYTAVPEPRAALLAALGTLALLRRRRSGK